MASLASCSTSSVARRAAGQQTVAFRMHALSTAARRVACRAHDTSDAPATSSTLRRMAASLAAAGTAAALIAAPLPAFAAGKVAEWPASGFLFKDTVEVTSFDDADVPGVTLYISDFKRSIADKLAKDFFSEPSQASLTCAATGPVSLRDVKAVEGSEGREVFSEKKGLNFFKDKTLRVRRIYDADHRSLVYVAYSTRLSGAADEGVSSGRYRTSICAVPLTPAPAPAAAAAAAAGAELN